MEFFPFSQKKMQKLSFFWFKKTWKPKTSTCRFTFFDLKNFFKKSYFKKICLPIFFWCSCFKNSV